MAQLNTSLSDMPWFGQPADPGASLARGVASGAQIANVQHQRASLAQQKMEFDQLQALRVAQEERAAALFPLVKTLKQQEMTMKGLELQDVLEGRQSLIEDKQIVSRGRQVADEYLNQNDPLRAKSFILDMTVQTPRLRNNQAWQELMANIDAAVKLGQEQAKINALVAQREASAAYYANRAANIESSQDLSVQREQRLQQRLDLDKQKLEREVNRLSPEQRDAYRAAERAIRDDGKLAKNLAEKQKRLDELNKRFGIAIPSEAPPVVPGGTNAPAASPGPTRFQFDINTGRILK